MDASENDVFQYFGYTDVSLYVIIQGVIKKFRDSVIENYNLLPMSKNI